MLNDARGADETATDARAIVVPHAGYDYSGPVAAAAFARLPGDGIKRVILLGPSHHFGFRGGALPAAGVVGFDTPLGTVPLDLDAIRALRGRSRFDGPAKAHDPEHSLEVELPFLQIVAPGAKLVPVAIGVNTDLAACREMAESLAAIVDDGTVVVTSSDFTHHGARYGWTPYDGPGLPDTLLHVARRTAERVVAGDPRGLLAQIDVSGDTVCGARPLAVLAALVEGAFDGGGSILEVTTSGHVTGSFGLSVSYVAAELHGRWRAWRTPRTPAFGSLTDGDGEALVELARAVIEGRLTHGTQVADWFADHPGRAMLQMPAGAFVTVNNTGRKARTDGRLRACMGVIGAEQPLGDAVVQAAVWATEDPRFPPLAADELGNVELEVSVLSPSKPVRSHRFIKVGVHGVVLSKDGRRAVYLPQVATEQGWSREIMLDQLSLKAGLPRKAWQQGAQFEVFTAQVFEEER